MAKIIVQIILWPTFVGAGYSRMSMMPKTGNVLLSYSLAILVLLAIAVQA